MRRLVRSAALALVVLLAPACDDDPTGPAPGVLEVFLIGPTDQVGALLFHVESGEVDSVLSAGFYTTSATFTGVERRVLVAGPRLQGVVARLEVPDIRAQYRLVAVEVADTRDFSLLEATKFSLVAFARPF